MARGSCLNRPERERPDVAVDRAVRGGVGARGRGGHRAEHLATQPVNTGAWPVGKVPVPGQAVTRPGVEPTACFELPAVLVVAHGIATQSVVQASPTLRTCVRACANVRCVLKVFCCSL